MITLITVLMLAVLSTGVFFWRAKICPVAEDTAAVTVNRDGFIQRVLPPGRHILRPFERIDFTLTTKTRLTTGHAASVATQDGIPVTANWSGTYALQPGLITEKRSQRLRGLQNAEKTIARQADIYLRKLIGDQPMRHLFNAAVRSRLERQLTELLTDHLKAQGIAFNNLNLQAIELPKEVTEAMNKAKAIETLDQTIRLLDPTTRAVVQGAYQLDEILHWDAYLPAVSRLALKQQAVIAQ